MLTITITLFILIALLGWLLNKSVFAPLFVFGVLWSVTLILLCFNSDDFYDLHIETYVIFSLGGVGFTLGSILANGTKIIKGSKNNINISIKKEGIVAVFAFLILGWFEYYQQISVLTSGANIFTSFQEARYALVQASLSGEKVLGSVANLEVISYIFVAIMAAEYKSMKYGNFYFFTSILIGVAYVTLGGAKGGLLTLAIMSYIIIYFYQNSIKSIKVGFFIFVLVAVLFSLGLYVVNFTYNEFSNGFELAASILVSIRNYWIGGLIAFDQVVQQPSSFIQFQSPTRFFLETANSLGANITMPPVHADYVNISNSEDTNVFTIFYSYYLFGGLLAVFVFMTIYAYCLGLLFRLSKTGNKRFLVLYASLLVGLVFSIVSERFFLSLNFTIKTIAFVWFFYGIQKIKFFKSKPSIASSHSASVVG